MWDEKLRLGRAEFWFIHLGRAFGRLEGVRRLLF